jgi:hypothetical protein
VVRKAVEELEVTLGFAADEAGAGVGYAELRRGGKTGVILVPFSCRRYAALEGREVAYAALSALADKVRTRHAGPVAFTLADASLVADLAERRALPGALVVPYVGLRCRLNRFSATTVRFGAGGTALDLTARARAAVSLRVAA